MSYKRHKTTCDIFFIAETEEKQVDFPKKIFKFFFAQISFHLNLSINYRLKNIHPDINSEFIKSILFLDL